MTSWKMDLEWMKIPYLYTFPRKTYVYCKLSSLSVPIFLVPDIYPGSPKRIRTQRLGFWRMIPWIIRLPILKGQGFFPVDGRSCWGVQEPQPASGRQGPTRSWRWSPNPPPKSWVCVVIFFWGSDCYIYIYINTKEKRSFFLKAIKNYYYTISI